MVFDLKKLFGKDRTEDYVEIDLNAAQNKENKASSLVFLCFVTSQGESKRAPGNPTL